MVNYTINIKNGIDIRHINKKKHKRAKKSKDSNDIKEIEHAKTI